MVVGGDSNQFVEGGNGDGFVEGWPLNFVKRQNSLSVTAFQDMQHVQRKMFILFLKLEPKLCNSIFFFYETN